MCGPPGVPPRLLLRQTSMIRALATSDDVRSKEPPLGFRERLQTLLHNWLACPDPLQQADRIFVLAGRRYRKSYGVNLLNQGWARGILARSRTGGQRAARENRIDPSPRAGRPPPRRVRETAALSDCTGSLSDCTGSSRGGWLPRGAVASTQQMILADCTGSLRAVWRG